MYEGISGETGLGKCVPRVVSPHGVPGYLCCLDHAVGRLSALAD